jgi:alpha-tubulin suppressor-like RCC1 family protein
VLGRNQYGQRGVGDDASRTYATTVTHADGSPISNVESLSVGWQHACAVVESGALWCWGRNDKGRISGGGGANAVSPTAVLGADGTPVRTAQSVHCGQGHTCPVLGDDMVWCWGRNGDGQLGVGSNTNTNALTVPVAMLKNVQSLSVGYSPQNCALLENATLRCWGENSCGSLGVGDIMDGATPVTVTAGIGDARSVSCGYRYTCAVGAHDDKFWCWGRNYQYQLGLDGPNTKRLVPTEVSGIKMLPRKCMCCETKILGFGFNLFCRV